MARLLSAVLLTSLLIAAPATAAAVVQLDLGKPSFWDGPTIQRANGTCGGACPSWKLEVPAGSARLRVAIDVPMRDDSFQLRLLDPAGKAAASATNSNAFDAEVFVAQPRAGSWTLLVTPENVSDSSFRMRAEAEAVVPTVPHIHQLVLPNLRAVPPMELGFVAPANPANGVYPPDLVNPPLDVAGIHPLSCSLDEMLPPPIGTSATRCLRLTSGPINVGDGPFEMRFEFLDDVAAGMSPIAKGPIRQILYYGDGQTAAHPAGTYSFHYTHAHFHDDDILTYELFKPVVSTHTVTTRVRVKRKPGSHKKRYKTLTKRVEQVDLVKASQGVKSGFCPANQLLGDWKAVRNTAPDAVIGSGDAGTGNCQDPSNGVLGLSPGWGDIYRWQRPGQFVPFDNLGDGRYVVRSSVDIKNNILESDDGDNAAYAYIDVVGENVKILERGRGLSPWDPKKLVFHGKGPAAAD
jgi:hypothetical protein